jgi:hypothetical protein
MKRYLRYIFGLVPVTVTALVLGVPTAAPELGLQTTGLSCSDGTDLNLALDAMSLTELTNAVDGINLNPAGDPALTCGLNQPVDPPSSGSAKDYAVGGGQVIFPCSTGGPGFEHQSFSLNAHVDADMLTQGVGGTFNTTIPQSPGCEAHGTIVSKIDCVEVLGNHANFTGVVTKATGIWVTFGVQPGQELAGSATDNSPIMPDTLQVSFGTVPCAFVTFGEVPIDRGNINVRDA